MGLGGGGGGGGGHGWGGMPSVNTAIVQHRAYVPTASAAERSGTARGCRRSIVQCMCRMLCQCTDEAGDCVAVLPRQRPSRCLDTHSPEGAKICAVIMQHESLAAARLLLSLQTERVCRIRYC